MAFRYIAIFHLEHMLEMNTFMTVTQPHAYQETNCHPSTVSPVTQPMCCSTWSRSSSEIFGLVR